jgi:hypothetical protein
LGPHQSDETSLFEAQKIPTCAPIVKFLETHDIPNMVLTDKMNIATGTARALMADQVVEQRNNPTSS